MLKELQENIRGITILVCFLLSISLGVYLMIFWFRNPHLTKMQVYIEKWPQLALLWLGVVGASYGISRT